MNWKKREGCTHGKSRIFGQPQAAGKTGPVIRIAKGREGKIMAGLLAETGGNEKPELAGHCLAFAPGAHIFLGIWLGRAPVAGTRKNAKTAADTAPVDTWVQASVPYGSLREAEVATGRLQLAPDIIDDLKSRGFTSDELYRIVAPRRTLARRKERNENLTVAESDRVLRLERISEMADRVFGSHEKAHRWLRSEIIALDGARPIDLLETETGARIVDQELIKIDYGMLA